jgi:hypothetical protein
MTYKLYKALGNADAAMKTNEDGSMTSFLFDPANTDFLEYQKWLREGNIPLPADEPSSSETV